MTLDIKPFLPLGKLLLSMAAIGLLLMAPTGVAAMGGSPGSQNLQTEQLAAMLGGTGQAARQAAIARTRQLGLSALPALEEALRSGPVGQRRGAVIGLSLMPVPQLTIDTLATALNDPDAVVRSLAAHALAKVGADAAPKAVELLGSPDNEVGIGAALALTRMRGAAVPALTEALAAPNDFVKAKAAWLLGRIGPAARPAVPALIKALDADDTRVMHVIAEAIDLIGADPAMVYQEMLLIGAASRFSPMQRIGADAAPTLTALLTRPGTPTGHAAMYALGRIGKPAESALRKALAKGTPSQRTAAALLLSDIDPEIVHTLPDDLRESLAGARRTQ